MNKGYH